MRFACPQLIGREAERRALESRLLGGAASPVPVVVVAEGGIGKSRLVDVVRTSCDRPFLVGGFAAPPSVRVAIREVAAAAVAQGANPRSEDLSLFRAALGQVLPGLLDRPPVPSDPVVLASALHELISDLDDLDPVVVVEDAHWADEESLAVLDQLVAQSPQRDVPLLITARPHESDELDGRIERWHASRAVELVELAPLGQPQTEEMIAACLGTAPPAALADRACRESGGVPFLIEELLTTWHDHLDLQELNGTWEFRDSTDPALPRSYAAEMARRLDRLHDDDRVLTVLAAMTSPGFSDEVLVAFGLDEAQIGRAVKAARRLGLLADERDEASSPAFRHELTRRAIVEATEPVRRRQIAATALRTVRVDTATDAILDAASELALLVGDLDRRQSLLLRLARRALATGQPSKALGYLDRAKREIDADHEQRRRIESMQLVALGQAGEIDAARELGQRVLPALVGAEYEGPRRRCLEALARIEGAAGAWDSAAALLNRIATPRTAEELAFAAVVAAERHDFASARERAEIAREAAGSSGAASAECEAIEVLGRLSRRSSYGEAVEWFELGVRVAERHGLGLWRARALFELGICDVTLRRDGASLDEAREAAIDAGSIAVAIMADNMHATMIGNDFDRCDEAIERCEAARSVARRIGLDAWEARLLATEGQAHATAGRPGEARARGETAIAIASDDGEVAALAAGQCRGLAALVADDPESALAAFQDAFDALESLPYRTAIMPWYDVAIVGALWDPDGLGDAAWRASHDAGVLPAVERWLPLAEAVQLGRSGEADHAAQLVEDVLVAASRMRRGGRRWGRVDLWMRYVGEAAAEDGWGRPEDWLIEAESGLLAVGAGPLARGCRAVLKRLGAPPRTRPDDSVPAAVAELGVTRREVDVLVLLTEGRTNKEIADELHISPRTAKSHLEHLFTKTGRRSRAELAELARQAGLADG